MAAKSGCSFFWVDFHIKLDGLFAILIKMDLDGKAGVIA